MQITSLSLLNFRCFKNKQFEFNPKINLITGVNGAGKSSILESLYYISKLRSLRTFSPSDLVNKDTEGFALSILINSQFGSDKIFCSYNKDKKYLEINNKISNYKHLVEIYKTILFSDDDISLVTGTPSERRSFLDEICSFLDPEYLSLAYRYKAVLENRNKIIHNPDLYSYENYLLWTEKFLELSNLIRIKRQHAVSCLKIKLDSTIKQFYQSVYQTVQERLLLDFDINYSIKLKFEDLFQEKKFDLLFKAECAAGRSLCGAHLDDLVLTINTNNAKSFASRGQAKLFSVLLKLSSAQINEVAPILLIDDFVSDFDSFPLKSLFNILINTNSQIFITSPLNSGIIYDMCTDFKAHIINI